MNNLKYFFQEDKVIELFDIDSSKVLKNFGLTCLCYFIGICILFSSIEGLKYSAGICLLIVTLPFASGKGMTSTSFSIGSDSWDEELASLTQTNKQKIRNFYFSLQLPFGIFNSFLFIICKFIAPLQPYKEVVVIAFAAVAIVAGMIITNKYADLYEKAFIDKQLNLDNLGEN